MSTALQQARPGTCYTVQVPEPDDFAFWRERARQLVQCEVPPDRVAVGRARRIGQPVCGRRWRHPPCPTPPEDARTVRASKQFIAIWPESAICHSDPGPLRAALPLAMAPPDAMPRCSRTAPIPTCASSTNSPARSGATATRCTPSSASAWSRRPRARARTASITSPGSSPSTISCAPMPASSCAASPTCAGRSSRPKARSTGIARRSAKARPRESRTRRAAIRPRICGANITHPSSTPRV